MQFQISFALSSAGVVGKKRKWRSCIIRGPNSSLVEPESGHCLRGGPSPTLWRRAFESLTWQNTVWVTESPGTSRNGRRGPWRWGGVMRVALCTAAVGHQGHYGDAETRPFSRDDRPIIL